MTVIGVAAGGAVVHELAHLAAALVFGIQVISFTPFDPAYLSPAIRISPDTDASLRPPFWYAGGWGAGLLMLLPLVPNRRWFLGSFDRWALGLSLATMGFVQLGLGVLEGAFHQLYIEGAGGGANVLVAAWAGMVGFLLYWRVFFRRGVAGRN